MINKACQSSLDLNMLPLLELFPLLDMSFLAMG